MQVTIAKLLSLGIALVFAVSLIVNQGGVTERAFRCCVLLLLPLALIWFPDELGRMKGYFGRGRYIDVESPPVLLSSIGWFCLVGLLLLFLFVS